MFEKPKQQGIQVPPEFLERSRRNQIEAVKRGDSWPTPEGSEDKDIGKAFEYYLGNLSGNDLQILAAELKKVGGEWTESKNKEISAELKSVHKVSNPARHLASLAAAISFIPLSFISAVGIKVTLNTLISTIEKLALSSTEEKVESYTEIQGHLEQLAELIEEEREERRDTEGVGYQEAA